MSDIEKTVALLRKTPIHGATFQKSREIGKILNASKDLTSAAKIFNENLIKVGENLKKVRIGENLLKVTENLNKSGLFETLKKVGETLRNLENNPELQFGFISDLEVLNLKSTEQLNASFSEDIIDDNISKTEIIIDRNLLPYLEKLKLDSLWLGANYALSSSKNPDKLRHCLISLRTLLENIIDEKLAPKLELANLEMFKKEFKDYNAGNESIEFVRIKREKKIEYFTSKIKFGFLDEFTKKDIDFICNCYSILCNIHQPEVGITENQVRILKVKTGITVWLLAYIHEIINE